MCDLCGSGDYLSLINDWRVCDSCYQDLREIDHDNWEHAS